MDLNIALQELGMLSLVTDSRKDYLKEKQSLKQCKDCFQVVQLNTQYVTCMGPVLRSRRPRRTRQLTSVDMEEASVSQRAAKPEPDMNIDESRVVRYRRTRRKYSKPYSVLSSARQRRITEPSDTLSGTGTSTDAAPSMVPNKFYIPKDVTARLLSRSKSMDELELQQQNISNHIKDGDMKQDNVEAVAKHMKELKVK